MLSSADVDEYDNFLISFSLIRQIIKQMISAELRYEFNWYKQEARAGNPVHEAQGLTSDVSNDTTEHRVFIRFIYYFGSGGA